MRLQATSGARSAPDGIEVPVDRIAKPQGAIAEQIEVALHQGVGLAADELARWSGSRATRAPRTVASRSTPAKKRCGAISRSDPKRRVGVGELRRVFPEQRLGVLGQLDRRHALEPFRGFLPAAIRQLREPHVADPAKSAAVAAFGLRAASGGSRGSSGKW